MIRFIGFLAVFVVGSNLWAQPKIDSIVNAATFQPGLPYGGGLATVFVSGLAAPPGTYVAQSSTPLPFALAGVGVEVNLARAPILAVVIPIQGGSALSQVNFQVPLERNASIRTQSPDGFPGNLVLVLRDQPQVVQVPLPDAPSFGGFFADAQGYAIAQHASDYSTVTIQNPAHPGETIISYANDLYPVWPSPPIGFPVPAQPLFKISTDRAAPGTSIVIPDPGHLYLQVYPTAGGTPLKGSFTSTPPLSILFQGLAPGLVGVEQINFVVPANQQPGDWALFFNTGCLPGQASGCETQPRSSPFVKLPVR